MSLYPQISAIFTPHQENFSLQQRPLKKIAANENVKLWGTVPIDIFIKHFCTKAQGKLLKWTRNVASASVSGGVLWVCLLVTSKDISIKSHQRDCPNVNWARRTPPKMLNSMEECPLSLNPIQELSATEESWEQKRWLFLGKSTWIVCLMPYSHPWKHT